MKRKYGVTFLGEQIDSAIPGQDILSEHLSVLGIQIML